MRKEIMICAVLVLLFQSGAGLAAVPDTIPQVGASPGPDTGCYRVLFDQTHGWGSDSVSGAYTISEAYSQLADLLRGQGHIVDALEDPALLDAGILQRYDVLVLALPAEPYTAGEKTDIAYFVNQGGRLVTIAENGEVSGDSRLILNDLHAFLGDGLLHNKDIIEDPTNNEGGTPRNPLIHTFSDNAINAGLSTVLELDAASLQVGIISDATAFGDEDSTVQDITAANFSYLSPGANESIVVQALVQVGAGDVFAVGDANLWDTNNLDKYDNARLALNVFTFGKQCTLCRWALIKDRDPWSQATLLGLSTSNQDLSSSNLFEEAYSNSQSLPNTDAVPQLMRPGTTSRSAASLAWLDPNEQVLREWGIPYQVLRSADIPGANLDDYCKTIIASDQNAAFYQVISDHRAWFESWVNAGGLLEFHAAPQLVNSWGGLPMPGGFSMSYFDTDYLSIDDSEHVLFKRPNMISDDEIDQWEFSAHGYLVNLPAGAFELVSHDDQGEPAAAKFSLGEGCVLATLQTLEWAWDRGDSPLLENYLRYDDCSGNYQLYFSLALNNAP